MAEMEMVERVARAMCEADGADQRTIFARMIAAALKE
jgi:hypothetical protein